MIADKVIRIKIETKIKIECLPRNLFPIISLPLKSNWHLFHFILTSTPIQALNSGDPRSQSSIVVLDGSFYSLELFL